MPEIYVPSPYQYRKIIGQLEDHPDGVSLLLNGEIPNLKEGYIVSITNNEVTDINPKIVERVLDQINQNKRAQFIGGWYSEVTKKHFIDASVLVNRLELALRMSNMYNQEAIFDVANNECIPINSNN